MRRDLDQDLREQGLVRRVCPACQGEGHRETRQDIIRCRRCRGLGFIVLSSHSDIYERRN